MVGNIGSELLRPRDEAGGGPSVRRCFASCGLVPSGATLIFRAGSRSSVDSGAGGSVDFHSGTGSVEGVGGASPGYSMVGAGEALFGYSIVGASEAGCGDFAGVEG